MNCEKRQETWIDEKTEEMVKTVTIQNGADVAERAVKEVTDTRKKMNATISYAIIFNNEVEELMEMTKVRTSRTRRGPS